MRKVLSLLVVLFVTLSLACGEKPAPPPAPTPVPTIAPAPSPVPPTPLPTPKPTNVTCKLVNFDGSTGHYKGSCGITDTCKSEGVGRYAGDPCSDPAK